MATLPILDQTQAMIGQAPGSAARGATPQPIERMGLRAAANYQSNCGPVAGSDQQHPLWGQSQAR
jgi:hypothetical protein